jgi:monoamine oxidase
MGIGNRTTARGRAARTPLFDAVRRGLRLASLADRPDRPPADELVEMRREALRSRRAAMKVSAASALALGGGSLMGQEVKQSGRREGVAPRIAIVGAGIAGLCAAHRLRKAGLSSTVFEASDRLGGRIFTAQGLLAPGLITELGGEFINSDHRDMIALVKELGLELLDLNAPGGPGDPPRVTCYVEGSHRTEAEIVEEFRPLAARLKADGRRLGNLIDFEHEGGARDLDRTTVAQYLDRIGAAGWIRKLVEVGYACEFGLDSDRLSALDLVFLISGDTPAGSFEFYEQSDERYKVKGGSRQIIAGLARRIEDQVRLEHRLEAIHGRGDGYRLSFAQPGGRTVDVDADFVVIAIPFSVLRHVKLRVELPDVQRKAIAELGYGTNSKLFASVRRRVWRDQGYTGSIYSDEPYQSAWDHSRLQPGEVAGLTFFSGGKAGLAAGAGAPAERVLGLIGGLDKAFPGVSAALGGTFDRFHWPSHPFAEGSYACYTPGQWTTIAGAEGLPAGNLFFAGEHCSFDQSGFMNSGVASGHDTAKALLARCRRGK